MNINFTIDNFLDSVFENEKEKTNLGMCFYQSLKTKVHPSDFEANISKGSIKINPLDKPEINKYLEGDPDYKDGWLTLSHTLNDKQILHYVVLYRLSYLKHHYPSEFDNIKTISISNNMNELFSMSKEELQDQYNKVNVGVGAN